MPMLFPYQDKDTPLHRLDARPKMVFVLAFFLLSILISDILYLSAMLVLALTVVARGRVARETLGLLKYTIYVVAFLFLFSIIFTPSVGPVLLDLGIVKITEGPVLFSISMSLRLVLSVVAFAVLTFTVHPDDLLRILSRLGFKSMTGVSIATRMYPTIAADSAAISDAMKARGVEFDDGSFVRRARARAPVMMPLLMNSMERSMNIAEAMEARGFGAGKRSRYKDPALRTADRLMMISFLLAIPFGVAMFIMGYGNVNYLAGEPLVITAAGATVAAVEILFFTPILLGGRQ
ncbi:MAG TPA: energy-coupling factor transporter transmembrane component T [Methanomassiliicoccaceae archaeon]|nr:energy-coupling factor transporter transmembrane component T [Methanomassiliicoccaceae archaeon]